MRERKTTVLHCVLIILSITATIQAIRAYPVAIKTKQANEENQMEKAYAFAKTACEYGCAYLQSNENAYKVPERFYFTPPAPFAIETGQGATVFNPESDSILIKIEPIDEQNAVVCAVAECDNTKAVVLIELEDYRMVSERSHDQKIASL